MATLALTAIGTLIGGPIGGAIGAVIGQSVDQMLLAPKPRQGPRLGDLAVQTSSYGSQIPKIFGTMRVAGTVIWATDLIETRSTTGGGKGRPGTVNYSYAASFAVALSARRVGAVRRIWADGKLLRGAAGDMKVSTGFRFHEGNEDQAADPLIAAAEGAEAPAYRGLAYAVFEEMELADFGNRIPSLTFELVADDYDVAIGPMVEALSDGAVRGGETPAIGGFAAAGDSLRGAIQDLADLAGLSLVDEDGLILGKAAGAPVAIPAAAEVGRTELVRRGAAAMPQQVSVTYYDAARDYQSGLQRAAARGPIAEARAERLGVPAAMDADMAKGLAEAWLDARIAARVTATVTLPWRHLAVGAGRLVRLTHEPGTFRVRRRTMSAMQVRLELERVAGASAARVPAMPGRATGEADQVHGPTIIRLHDLPLAEGAAGRPFVALLAAGSAPGWRRAGLSVSLDGGASHADIGRTALPAVIGTTLTALPPGGAALFDRTASVDVALLHEDMALMSRDEDALVGGANLALIGDELIQFGAAEPVAPGRYRLSRLLRGRRGTEWAAADHGPGEDFALIDAARLVTIDAPVGASLIVLATGVGDAVPAAAALAVTGEALRPPSPVHLSAMEIAGGGLQLRWVRRSRSGWAWGDGADAPLSEERELYRLTLATAGGGERIIETAEPAWLYPAAERAADGPGATLSIVQIGTAGVSRAATISLE